MRRALLLSCLLAGCGDATPTQTVGEIPAQIVRLNGNSQFDFPGATLDVPLRIQVVDARSLPVPGVRISWITTPQIDFEFKTNVTDIGGKAVAWAILGRAVGTYEVTAQVVEDTSLVARFQLFATADGDAPIGPTPVATVTVSDAGFTPRAVSARVLDGVKWVWRGTSEAHDVFFDDPEAVSPGFGNNAPKHEGSYTGVMNREGVITYYCSVHGRDAHSGTITVTN